MFKFVYFSLFLNCYCFYYLEFIVIYKLYYESKIVLIIVI